MFDALGRSHQCATVQLDFNLPERFDLRYIDSEDTEQRPVMIHRAMLGSLERFIGILIEHCAGAFPFWLAPEQVRLLSITERSAEFASQIAGKLKNSGIRAHADVRNETIGAKIREAQLEKIPAMLIVGDREAADGTVSLRLRGHGDLGAVPADAFVERAEEWARERTLELTWTPPADCPATTRS